MVEGNVVIISMIQKEFLSQGNASLKLKQNLLEPK